MGLRKQTCPIPLLWQHLDAVDGVLGAFLKIADHHLAVSRNHLFGYKVGESLGGIVVGGDADFAGFVAGGFLIGPAELAHNLFKISRESWRIVAQQRFAVLLNIKQGVRQFAGVGKRHILAHPFRE